jgi:cytidylate kinase
MAKRIIIAIDGPAGAGKSTVARNIASRLGFIYIDTGAMYRSVAVWALRTGVDLTDMHRLEQLAAAAHIEFEAGSGVVLLNGEDVTQAIREPRISDAASMVSAVPGVRRAMVAKQREMAASASVVMEGRDIGSIVFPEAQVKVFLDADAATRTHRRAAELSSQGRSADVEKVGVGIAERDRRDRTRQEAPLVQAADAVYLDTTRMSISEVEEAVLQLVRVRTANGKEVER